MNFHLNKLILRFKNETVTLPFVDFNYFYGEMGAGKSSIARLIDFCLGGNLVDTQALQSEFVWANLNLTIGQKTLDITREYHSNQVRASWSEGGQSFEVMVPAREAKGPVLPDTEIETLSDLIFHLAAIVPPKIRRSQQNADSDLVRLSFRNLWWYCYLDQDSMDSSFFKLERDGNFATRLASVSVLRYVLGFHQEKVAELQARLDNLRNARMEASAGFTAIKRILSEEQLPSELEIEKDRSTLRMKLIAFEKEAEEIRRGVANLSNHAMEQVRIKARELYEKIAELENAQEELRLQVQRDKAHRNELLNLGTKFRRAQAARAVLGAVAFCNCPRCSQALPERDVLLCPVCGQNEPTPEQTLGTEKVVEADLDARIKELDSVVDRQEKETGRIARILRNVRVQKEATDKELSALSTRYDSAYLSRALESEKQVAVTREKIAELDRYSALVKRIDELQVRSQSLSQQETQVRATLKEARELAEKDNQSLERLKRLFLDCLVRAKIAGFLASDVVEIKSPYYLPEVFPSEGGELTSTSFAQLGSGGKKTLFKTCFAIALHILAIEQGAVLPTILIIDSPMKNISERINRKQFEGFHEMLYSLCANELKGTQIILIDKELLPPISGFASTFQERFMTPDRSEAPPLITRYRGK
jgi:hypothetical protein